MPQDDASRSLALAAEAKWPILDLRPWPSYLEQRVRGAVHMQDVTKGLCWLPDTHEPLLVVVPASGQQHAADGGAGVSVEEYLHARHWSKAVCLRDSPELWQAAGSQGLLDPPGVPASALKRRLLFKPAALLGQEIEGIERALMGGQAEAGSKLRALEPGCGSARNLIALAVRERPGLSWHVLGADSSYPLLVRAQQQLQHVGVPPDHARLWHGSICSKTGALVPCPGRSTGQEAADQQPHMHITSLHQAEQDLEGVWHLIIIVRFLERAFLARVPQLLAPGGFVLVCHFLDMEGTRKFGRPRGDSHLLQPGELAAMFGPKQGFAIVRDDVLVNADGRELSMFVAALDTTQAAL